MIGDGFLTDPDILRVMLRSTTVLRSTTAVAVISSHWESSAITHKYTGYRESLR